MQAIDLLNQSVLFSWVYWHRNKRDKFVPLLRGGLTEDFFVIPLGCSLIERAFFITLESQKKADLSSVTIGAPVR
jgi:hypothetical protein